MKITKVFQSGDVIFLYTVHSHTYYYFEIKEIDKCAPGSENILYWLETLKTNSARTHIGEILCDHLSDLDYTIIKVKDKEKKEILNEYKKR